MFIKTTRSGCLSDGTQVCSGLFLLLFDRRDEPKTLYACVRRVAMTQLGHYMMGTARVGGYSVICSGSYGGNGLPKDLHELDLTDGPNKYGYKPRWPGIEKHLTKLPDELYAQWANGNGWNSAGSEGPSMRKWALEHLRELTPKRRK